MYNFYIQFVIQKNSYFFIKCRLYILNSHCIICQQTIKQPAGEYISLLDERMNVDAQRYAVNAKACIQKNGRLGFTREAAELLGLKEQQTMLFSNTATGDMAAVVCDESEVRGFRIQKAGNYFYIR